ncbi:hypothetical protein J2X31_001930 [Flavobacterium arsenatis]|uniref:HEPN AbiU2-like domain-containing protein n=1 Tax=Flavobacterium arsenatis TaxID=1484332 RepID=A0ABU1TPT6_9FLAO|nr:hypothetical protein [Flavobacterium arsenatis]MDR6967916.1 hypothetical protein [Flavobacterium arsenatis]
MENSKLNSLLNRIKNLDKNYNKILVPPWMSKQITSYMLIREDLFFVKTNAELLINCKNNKLRVEHTEEALWYSLIIIYGRCFSNATKGQKVKLDKEKLFSANDLNNNHLLTHNKLIDIRNNFIAHRGDNENEIPIVYLKLPVDEIDETYQPEFEIVSTRYVTDSFEFLEEIVLLINFLIPQVDMKLKKCGEKLKKGLFSLEKDLLLKLTIKI